MMKNRIMEAKTIQKYKDQTVPNLIKKATKYFNEYIRLRDSKGDWFICIACGKAKHKSMCHASHYFNAGQHAAIRFHEDNVHAGCSACNTHRHGNLLAYRVNLLKKIGQDRLGYLESVCRKSHKWDRFSLIEIIETYKQKVKDLKGE